jgi:hypothetical protein
MTNASLTKCITKRNRQERLIDPSSPKLYNVRREVEMREWMGLRWMDRDLKGSGGGIYYTFSCAVAEKVQKDYKLERMSAVPRCECNTNTHIKVYSVTNTWKEEGEDMQHDTTSMGKISASAGACSRMHSFCCLLY